MADSSSPAQIDELPGWRQGWEQDKRDRPRQIWKDRIRTWSGWNRLTGACRNTPSKELLYLSTQYEAETCRAEYAGEEDNELPYFDDSFKQAARLTTFGDVPLVVISRDTRGSEQRDDAIWDREQEQLKSLSPKSWRVIAARAGHGVHHDRPEVVTSQTNLLIARLSAARYSSTVGNNRGEVKAVRAIFTVGHEAPERTRSFITPTTPPISFAAVGLPQWAVHSQV